MRGALPAPLVLAAAMALAGSARADDAPAKAAAPAQTAAAPAASDRPVRVRASHRVDVIAPGERVDTIIDRMRAGAAASDGKVVDRPQIRALDSSRGDGRGGPDQRGQGGRPAPPPTSNQGPPGPPAPPSERTHR